MRKIGKQEKIEKEKIGSPLVDKNLAEKSGFSCLIFGVICG